LRRRSGRCRVGTLILSTPPQRGDAAQLAADIGELAAGVFGEACSICRLATRLGAPTSLSSNYRVELSQIMAHEAGQPNAVAGRFDAGDLISELSSESV
jgi:hypothetical protein